MSNQSAKPVFSDRTDLDERQIPYPEWPKQLPANTDPTNASIKESFGSHSDFVHSYGHQLTPDGFDAANEVRDAFRQADQSQQNSK